MREVLLTGARRRAPQARRSICRTCAACGTGFTVPRSRADEPCARYCSVACRQQGRIPRTAALAAGPTGAGAVVDVNRPRPIPPRCFCEMCQVRPVAATGPFAGCCARCRAVPWITEVAA